MLNDAIKNANSIVVFGHKNLDGDLLGGMLAMGHFLKNEFGKNPILAFEGVIPDNLRWLSNGWWLKKAKDIQDSVFDLAILLDTADIDNQLDAEARALFGNARQKIKIDHHMNSPAIADINIIEIKAATSEIIANISVKNGWKITREIARFLYTGIYTDTGGFIFDYTTPETLRTAANLMEFGIAPYEISRNISEKTEETFANNVETLARTIFTDDGKIGYATFSIKKTNETERPHRETSWLHSQILSVKEVEASAIFKETDDGKILVSIRSKEKPINVFVCQMGGGGHLLASAFMFEGTLASAVVSTIPKLQSFLNAGV